MTGRKKRKTSAIGLDIGNGAIKLVEVKASGDDSYELTRQLVTPTPPDVVANGVINDRKAFITCLKSIAKEFKLGKQEVSTVLTGQNLVVRLLTVPAMPPYEFEASLKFQAGAYLGLPADNLTYDFQIIEQLPNAQMQVFLVGSPKEPIVSFAQTLRKAGVAASRVDIEPLAALRSLELTNQLPESGTGETVVIIDLGAGTSNLSIFRNGVLQMVRVIGVAGNDFTHAIMTAQGCSFEEAEALKHQHGVQPDSPIADIVQPILSRLLRQIVMSFEYYQVENRQNPITQVRLIGGSSQLAGLLPLVTERIEELFGRIVLPLPQVELGNPCAGLGNAGQSEESGPVLAVAIGLALGEVMNDATS